MAADLTDDELDNSWSFDLLPGYLQRELVQRVKVEYRGDRYWLVPYSTSVSLDQGNTTHPSEQVPSFDGDTLWLGGFRISALVSVLPLATIQAVRDRGQQYALLLLLRHHLGYRLSNLPIAKPVRFPPWIFQRAQTYFALGYPDLAAADAFIVYSLCENIEDGDGTTLEATTEDGSTPWAISAIAPRVVRLSLSSLVLLTRSLFDLGCLEDAKRFYDRIPDKERQIYIQLAGGLPWKKPVEKSLLLDDQFSLFKTQKRPCTTLSPPLWLSRFGMCSRSIYPWNEHEDDRHSEISIADINIMLEKVAPDIRADVVELPSLSNEGSSTSKNYQLGLFARKDLPPGTTILKEKSTLTAIRPRDDALCDACAADLSDIHLSKLRQCQSPDCDVTFCSKACEYAAMKKYHRPSMPDGHFDLPDPDASSDVAQEEDATGVNERVEVSPDKDNMVAMTSSENDDGNDNEKGSENTSEDMDVDEENEKSVTEEGEPQEDGETDEGEESDQESDDDSFEPRAIDRAAPFCGDSYLHEIGRVEDSSTPEWDLYWLLLTRAFAMAETQVGVSPLDLPEIRYLWGDFGFPFTGDSLPEHAPVKTLPFSFRHHIEQPLQWLEELMTVREDATPYSHLWFEKYDWWIIQTLYAKFRGVANAQLSTFNGQPEIAAVHPLWCLANHSCNPNVSWTSSGTRVMTVRDTQVWQDPGKSAEEWTGIKAGEQIWSHYTDIELNVRQRRDNLEAVLGGSCICERCIMEAKEGAT